MAADEGELASRVAALPGLDRVLRALEGLPPAYLVGGAVRDLLRGAPAVDLDLAVAGDALAAARELARRLGGEATEHGRFGTALVRAGDVEVDLATTRRERYPHPGALPVVEPAGLEQDLARRDFTVNAMAVALSAAELGRLHDPYGGARDLGERSIRVLHYRSFSDDPTRLLRAVRYEVRLGFAMEGETEGLAREAAGTGALDTVSGTRVRDALLTLLGEPDVAAGVERLGLLGLDRAMHPALAADAELVAGAALGALEARADRVLAALAALVASDPQALSAWLRDLGLARSQEQRVSRAATRAPELARALAEELSPSALHALLEPEPPEALALALAEGAPAEPVLRYVGELRDARLEISGDDLVRAGVPESPAVGRALAETLRRKLDGEVSGRDDELKTAIALAREPRR